jgi:hypothetical protein
MALALGIRGGFLVPGHSISNSERYGSRRELASKKQPLGEKLAVRSHFPEGFRRPRRRRRVVPFRSCL